MSKLLFGLLLGLFVVISSSAQALDYKALPGQALAQLESGDDAYDPFADYSEFEEASEEEADINFFRNGRFFSLGALIGYRHFTGTFPSLYGRGYPFGVFLTYFFDLRTAVQVSYTTGEHAFTLSYPGGGPYSGKVALSALSFHLKYFFITQNVTKGLAAFNPYLIGGFSQNYRTLTLNGIGGFNRDGASSLDVGVGIEVPLSKHKWFIGLQALYQVINLPDENTPIYAPDAGGNPINTGVIPKGDIYQAMAVLGINF